MMGLLICKYEPLWQEVSVKSLILRWPLRPVGFLFHYNIRIWNYQPLYAECILKVDNSYLLTKDTSFVHRSGLGSPKEWSRIMGCVWLQTLPRLTVMSWCSTVMELVPRYALCYTWVTFSPTYIAEQGIRRVMTTSSFKSFHTVIDLEVFLIDNYALEYLIYY